jgi:hypothetical protein
MPAAIFVLQQKFLQTEMFLQLLEVEVVLLLQIQPVPAHSY